MAKEKETPVAFSCSYLNVRKSSYYKSLKRTSVNDKGLDDDIELVFRESFRF